MTVFQTYKIPDPSFKGAYLPVEVIVQSRNGTKSPDMILLRHKGRLISPYEQRIRNWSIPLHILLKILYRGANLADLVFRENPFLSMIAKDEQFGQHYPIPIIK